MYEMHSSDRYFMYEFLCMYLFIDFIVYGGYFKFVSECMFKFVSECMFLMYLVMDHMHWISCVFEHSSSIWSVCVCYFVLLNRYWGIVTVPGSFLKAVDLGWPDPHPSP